ncbi:hypothetical protein LXM94_09645, partial [Rhizobium sp. TRM95111]|uniref:hypothetical protein n=1 Tax=Rhizobium alarense TaxID=2846851 RepID=UPI001F2C7ACD
QLAQQRSRCTHAVELRSLSGLSLPLTFKQGAILNGNIELRRVRSYGQSTVSLLSVLTFSKL